MSKLANEGELRKEIWLMLPACDTPKCLRPYPDSCSTCRESVDNVLKLLTSEIEKAKVEARKDTERLDFLQSLNDKKSYTGKAMLRMSTTGRGWRLHETEQEHAKQDVREAIDEFAELSKLQEKQNE